MNVFSFSGGRTSAYMLRRYYKEGDLVIFANTGKEASETLDFVEACSVNWNIPIIWIEYTTEESGFKVVDYKTASRAGEPFSALIDKRKYLPNVVTRYCTTELKVRPMKKYLKSIGIDLEDITMYLGIRADEERRYFKLKDSKEHKYYNYMPLYKEGINELDIMNFWNKNSFDLKLKQFQGNCDLCFLKAINKKLKILKESPDISNWWIEQEEKTEQTFKKGVKVSDLLKKATTQLEIFEDYSDSIECFCNID